MNRILAARIARIVSPNVVELDLKRRARFGKLNLTHSFDLVGTIQASMDRGDIRKQFARVVTRQGA